jgi:transcriptional regulator with XRE-family HTH domain
MGWSQSDLARHLEIEVDQLSIIEKGSDSDWSPIKAKLTLYWLQAESIAEEVQISALVEKEIEERDLNQLFQSEINVKFPE